jgi:hypothetical protein
VLFRSALLSVAFWAVFLAGIRLTVVPPETCGQDNLPAIQNAATQAIGWIERNQLSDGTFVYEYNANTNTTSTDYNDVRHAGVTMALYQAAGRFHDSAALTAADRGLGWERQHLVQRHGWSALTPDGQGAVLGSSALMLVGLTERRAATGDHQYDDLMHQLAGFITALQGSDGNFAFGYDFTADAPQSGTSTYYPGESLWALTLMHNAFPGEGWDAAARSALNYIATRRDDDVGVSYPPVADQWAAYGIAEISQWGGLNSAEIDYAHRLAARFGLFVRTEAQRDGSWYGKVLRGPEARGAGAGTWIEGVAALWRASQFDTRLADLARPTAERATCIAGIMTDIQVTAHEAKSYPQPGLAEGAWYLDADTRMDDQQHTFSGLIYTADLLQNNPHREPTQLLSVPSP